MKMLLQDVLLSRFIFLPVHRLRLLRTRPVRSNRNRHAGMTRCMNVDEAKGKV